MNIEFYTLILIAVGILVLGGIGVYLWLKSNFVKREILEQSTIELTTVKAELSSASQHNFELKNAIQTANTELKILAEQLTEKKVETNHLVLKNNESIAEKNKYRKKLEEAELDLNSQQANLIQLESNVSVLQEKLHKQQDDFEVLREKSLTEFESLANKLFEEKSTKFSKQNKENIEQILAPLKENLSEFKKKVEETYDKESKQRFSLEEKIKDLVNLNEQISQDANNLTNALKGQAKTQGDWGEMILESILEYSGLVKNREYFVQESFSDEKGNRKQPDVTIKYPDDRYVIIDSKVSLTAYERFANETDKEQQKTHLHNHLISIKSHVDNLSSKEYERRDKALDFVFLFIPIEPAFLTALNADSELWNYAYSRRIVILSPTNLIATLRVIADVWSKEIQNLNAREISKRGKRLYEKFVGFVSDMESIKKGLSKATESYDLAMKKLHTGSGNLVGQAQKLKDLGINTSKQIPTKYLNEENELEDGNPEVTNNGDNA